MQVHRCSIDCFHPTPRQLELIEMVSQGLSNSTIAIRLGCSPYTVRNQLSALYDRLDVGDRALLVRRAYELGLLTLKSKAA